jgi:hypothetical protein
VAKILLNQGSDPRNYNQPVFYNERKQEKLTSGPIPGKKFSIKLQYGAIEYPLTSLLASSNPQLLKEEGRSSPCCRINPYIKMQLLEMYNCNPLHGNISLYSII